MQAFHVLKLALTSNPVVAFPRSDRAFALILDASTNTQVDKLGAFHVISYES